MEEKSDFTRFWILSVVTIVLFLLADRIILEHRVSILEDKVQVLENKK